jgi:hypothetical protein
MVFYHEGTKNKTVKLCVLRGFMGILPENRVNGFESTGYQRKFIPIVHP